MLPRVLKARCVFVGLEIGMDELNEAVEIFRCDLGMALALISRDSS